MIMSFSDWNCNLELCSQSKDGNLGHKFTLENDAT